MESLSFEQVQQHLNTQFACAMQKFQLDHIDHATQTILIKRMITAEDLRPGNTVSGPTLMQVADFAAYVSIIADQGLLEAAFTTNLNINFLRRGSAQHAIFAQAKVLKAGRHLATVEVSLYSESSQDLIAHAVASFALIRGS